MEMWRRIAIVLIGLFECLMFAGCIFGWPALLHILQTEGIYSHLCNGSTSLVFVRADGVKMNVSAVASAPKLDASNISIVMDEDSSLDLPQQFEDDHKGFYKCKEQDEKFGLIFTICVVLYGCPAILVGFCLDKFGLRVTRLFASSMITSGFICLAFATKEESWLVFLGFVLIGTGANPIRMCALQYANLFPAQRSTILFVYTSAHSISTLVFLIFQNAHAFGASLQAICLTAACIAGMTFGSTFIMPCMKTEHKEDENPKKEENEEKIAETKGLTNGGAGDSEKESVALSNNGKDTKVELLELEKKNEPPKPVPVWKSVKTLSYAFHIFWLMNLYNLRFYITCFNPWAYKTTDDSKQVAFFNQVNGIFILASPFFAPVGGIITDHLVKRASKIEDKVDRMAKTFQAPTYCLIAAATLIFSVLVCRLFFTPAAVYASLFLISLSRPMVIGSFFAYTRIRFLPDHFNRLTGIGFTLVSILSIFQYTLFKWQFSSDENYYRVIIGLMVVTVLTLVSPGHILINKLARKYAAERMSTVKDN